MKKLLIVFSCLLFAVGCAKIEDNVEDNNEIENSSVVSESETSVEIESETKTENEEPEVIINSRNNETKYKDFVTTAISVELKPNIESVIEFENVDNMWKDTESIYNSKTINTVMLNYNFDGFTIQERYRYEGDKFIGTELYVLSTESQDYLIDVLPFIYFKKDLEIVDANEEVVKYRIGREIELTYEKEIEGMTLDEAREELKSLVG